MFTLIFIATFGVNVSTHTFAAPTWGDCKAMGQKLERDYPDNTKWICVIGKST